jgi:UDP-3-O-[3-hydroxymyristoyl] glucosamine N-acyltransferase
MTEPIFFKRGAGLTVAEIVALTGAKPHADAPLDRRITGIAALDRAGPHDLAFCDKPKFAAALASSRAGACLTVEAMGTSALAHTALLYSRRPYAAFVIAAQALFPQALRPSSLMESSGVTAGAFVHPSARLEAGVVVDPAAVVGPRAEIGARTVLAPGAVIGPDVRIGRDCTVGAHASIMHSLIGDRVIIHSGCRIGTDGYGFLHGPAGPKKIPQIGRVIIQDDVEIGANSCIDRGTMTDTVVGESTKIDNLVQIGHNTVVGRHCVLVAQVGISGSVRIEDHVMLGGQVGVADHVIIGERANIAGGSRVFGNIPAGATWGGYPARPWRGWLRSMAHLQRLGERAAVEGPAPTASEEGKVP